MLGYQFVVRIEFLLIAQTADKLPLLRGSYLILLDQLLSSLLESSLFLANLLFALLFWPMLK